MLVLTRRSNQSVIIELAPDADPNLTIGEVFSDGPLVVTVNAIKSDQVKLGIDAPAALRITRSELA